jgi:hypothetical protein
MATTIKHQQNPCWRAFVTRAFNPEFKHVFTYSFPYDAEKAFIEKYEVYRKELEIEGALH